VRIIPDSLRYRVRAAQLPAESGRFKAFDAIDALL
jgi:hypothetical protein